MDSMTIRVDCGACSARLGYAARRAGRLVSCSGCGADVRVPGRPVLGGDLEERAAGLACIVGGTPLAVLALALTLASGGRVLFYGLGAVGLGLTLCGLLGVLTGIHPRRINRLGG